MNVSAGADGPDPVTALALGPPEVMPDAELAADERQVLVAEPKTAPLAGLADDGEIRGRAKEDDGLLVHVNSPPF
jgi:hypothetical protein